MSSIQCLLRVLRVAGFLMCYVGFNDMAWGGAMDSVNLKIGNFSEGVLAGWQNKEFKGKTDYAIVNLDGVKALKATSSHTASGLYYEKKIDLVKTPMLHWRWRADKTLANDNELDKAGDDFAARVYVVVSGGLVFWNTKAVNYVWASRQPKNRSWPNPFAGSHAMMLALRSNDDKTGTWYSESRDVRADFQRLTGEDIRFIDAVAIMTDTDNSRGVAEAYYGDIYFTAK